MKSYNQAQTLPTRILFHLMQANVSVKSEDLKNRTPKKTLQQSPQIAKRLLIAGDYIVKNIEPYKMKESTEYVTTGKWIPGATTEGMIHHLKIVWLILGLILGYYTAVQMILKKLIPQKNTQNILKLAKDVSDGSKRDVLVTEIINRGDDFNFHAKMHRVNEFLPEIRTRKNAKYLDNGNIGLGMLNRSKLYLNRFGTIQLIQNYREILKV